MHLFWQRFPIYYKLYLIVDSWGTIGQIHLHPCVSLSSQSVSVLQINPLIESKSTFYSFVTEKGGCGLLRKNAQFMLPAL